MPLPRALARFNRTYTNRVGRKVAGLLPAFWVLRHTGRTSGRTYETPVAAFARDSGYVIALTYGPDADWLRNVLAAGGCELRAGRRVVRLHAPRVVTDPANAWASLPVRLILRAIGSTQHLRLDVSPDATSQRSMNSRR